jgi:rubrerythrin
MVLTQKETTLIKDLKGQEQLCIDKYTRHAECAKDPQLKQLFTHIADVERGHLNTLNQIERGEAPAMGRQSKAQIPAFTAYHTAETPEKQQDCYLCSDLLTTEKHASGLYNTCVFEFGQTQLRQVLNHIQTEEQEHGDMIYKYMKANGMYS